MTLLLTFIIILLIILFFKNDSENILVSLDLSGGTS